MLLKSGTKGVDMRIAVIGSRHITNKEWLTTLMNTTVASVGREDVVPSFVSGGSEGINSLVHEWARETGYDSYMFKPHFLIDSKADYSPRDFFTRYRQIVDNADKVIAVRLKAKEEPDLQFAIEYATKKGKTPLVVFYDVV